MGVTLDGKRVDKPASSRARVDPEFFADTLPSVLRLDVPLARPFFDPATGDFSGDIPANLSSGWFQPEEDYNVTEIGVDGEFVHVQGYENHLAAFKDDKSPDETAWRKSKIDREDADREKREESGALGMVAGFVAGTALDPTIFFPSLFAASKTLKGAQLSAKAVAKTGLATGVTGAGVIAGEEAVLHFQQETRTAADTIPAVGGALILGSVLGSAGGAIKLGVAKMADDIDAHFKITPEGEPDTLGVHQVTISENELLDETQRAADDLLVEPVPRDKAEKNWEDEKAEDFLIDGDPGEVAPSMGVGRVAKWINPALKLAMDSVHPDVRRAVSLIAPTHWNYKSNVEWKKTGESATLATITWNRPMEEAFNSGRDLWVKMRTGKEAGGRLRGAANALAVRNQDRVTLSKEMSYREFKRLAFKSAFFSDEKALTVKGLENAPPEVRELAKVYREKIFEPMKEQLLETGFLKEGDELPEFYMPRQWNREYVRTHRGELKAKTIKWLTKRSQEIVPLEGPGKGKLAKTVAGDRGPDAHEGGWVSANEALQDPNSGNIGEYFEANVDPIGTKARLLENQQRLQAKSINAGEKERLLTKQRELQAEATKHAQSVSDGKKINANLRAVEQRLTAVDFKRGEKARLMAKQKSLTTEAKIKAKATEKGARPDPVGKGGEPSRAAQTELTPVGRGGEPSRAAQTELTPVGRGGEPSRAAQTELTPAVRGGEASRSGGFDPSIQRGGEASRVSRLDLPEAAPSARRVSSREVPIPAPNPRWRMRHPDLQAPGAIEAESNKIIDRILGTGDRGIGHEGINNGELAGFPHRTFGIEDEEILDFLNDDIEEVAMSYIKTWAPAVEMKKRFPSMAMVDGSEADGGTGVRAGDLVEEFARIRAEKARLIDRVREENPRKPKESLARAERRWSRKEAQIEKRSSKDIEMLRKLIRITLGWNQDGIDTNPTGWTRAGRQYRNFQVMRTAGKFVAASIPDPFAVALSHGFTRTFAKPMLRAVTGFKAEALKMQRAELRRSGVAAETVFSRANALADITDEFADSNIFERFGNERAKRFFIHNLQTPWNQEAKMFAGVIAQTRMLDVIDAVGKGKKVSKKDRTWMAKIGLDENDAGAIHDQWRNSTTQSRGGVKVANSDEWVDQDTAWLWKQATIKSVEGDIITPRAGQRPFYMHTPGGKMWFQYKSHFIVSMVNYTMQVGQQLSMRQWSSINNTAMMLSSGVLVYAIKQTLNGREISHDPWTLALEGVDRSGLTGPMFDIINAFDMATGFGPSLLTEDNQTLSRYRNTRRLGAAIAGPGIGGAMDFGYSLYGWSHDDFSEQDAKTARRWLPYNNWLFADKGFQALEESIFDAFN